MNIRHITSHPEYEGCVELQRATWGDDFRELVPPAMLKIAQQVGGLCAGAYLDGTLVGFVYGLTGFVDGTPLHWSHMLAVREGSRDGGIGRALKEFQRQWLVDHQVFRVRWTFDPLVARNAHLNINRLGAAILTYVPDMYGENPMSRTDSVIGTDRLIADWDLRTPMRNGDAPSPPDAPVVSAAVDPAIEKDGLPDTPRVLIEVPEDIQRLKQHDPSQARAWRRVVRVAFLHYLEHDYRVTGVARDRRVGRVFYVLST